MNLTYNDIIVHLQYSVGIYGSLEHLLQQVCKGDNLFQYIETDHEVINFSDLHQKGGKFFNFY